MRGTGYETRCPLKAQWLEWRAVTTASNASEERKSAKSSTGVRAKAVACTAAGANSVRRAASTAKAVPTALEDLRNPPAKRRIRKERIQ